jgi:LuxR family quorum sensing-dependent transcriptional regulator
MSGPGGALFVWMGESKLVVRLIISPNGCSIRGYFDLLSQEVLDHNSPLACKEDGMPEAVDYGRDALDFIVDIERIKNADLAMDAMDAAFRRFGFETLIVTGLPNPNQRFEQMVMAKRWPVEWFKIYTANQYDKVDPVVRLCRRSLSPFEWSEAPYSPEKEPAAAEVMRRATDFRMSRGFIVPIHGLTGFEACISLGGECLDLNPRSKPAVHLMAMYGFDRIRRLISPAVQASPLTPREREVIAWASQGKTAWETGEILHITQRTVEEHATRACQKLGAMNRVHAVAIAIRERFIEP